MSDAAHNDHGSFGIKRCPRCGELLYEDMDVCYGCLYDFTRDVTQPPPGTPPALGEVPAWDAGLPSTEWEWDEKPEDDVLDAATLGLEDIDEPSFDGEMVEEREAGFAALGPSCCSEDTVDLSSAREALVREALDGSSKEWGVLVRTLAADVWVPLPERGLLVGRDPLNDIVLHARTVSRRHLRLVPAEGGVEASDLGSTNPAIYLGERIASTVLVAAGGSIDVCGCELVVTGPA